MMIKSLNRCTYSSTSHDGILLLNKNILGITWCYRLTDMIISKRTSSSWLVIFEKTCAFDNVNIKIRWQYNYYLLCICAWCIILLRSWIFNKSYCACTTYKIFYDKYHFYQQRLCGLNNAPNIIKFFHNYNN